MPDITRILKPIKTNSFFLFGPRQTGKSTFIKSFFNEEETLYYDLLDVDVYPKLLGNPASLRDEVLERGKSKKYVVIDEVQKIPQLLDLVHWLLENDPNPAVFCLSGSSARKLKRGQANLLGGRALAYSMHPLTFIELGEKFFLDRALNYGTLPSVYFKEDQTAKETLKSYTGIYLEEEIKLEALVRNLEAFLSFLRLAGEENGNILNFSNIARETYTSSFTIKEYFRILEDTLLGFFLPPHSKSFRKKLIHPKFYFFDMGVQRALTHKLGADLVRGTKEYGRVFEHFIIREIVYLSDYLRKDYSFSFFRESDTFEVDLIVETPQKEIFAIEIKATDNIYGGDFKGLRRFKEEYPKAELMCASLVQNRREIGGIMTYPWREVFEMLGLCNFT